MCKIYLSLAGWDSIAAIFGKKSVEEDDDELAVEDDSFLEDDSWERKGCIAHILQLVVNDSIKKCEKAKPLLENLTQWINFFRRSPKWTEELKSKTGGRDLKLVGGIRWSAIFFGLERFTEVSFELFCEDPISTRY